MLSTQWLEHSCRENLSAATNAETQLLQVADNVYVKRFTTNLFHLP